MVATIAAGTTAKYYSKQSEYYLGGGEPKGRWITSTNDFGIRHGDEVDNAHFERLHAGLDDRGKPLLSNSGDVSNRVGGIDLTLSAPKSVSVAFALAEDETRRAIEMAQQNAVEATISFLETNATFCRRGKNGHRLERASVTAASFQHGEARPVAHDNGKVFADPNLHTHAVLLNISLRNDGTVGALDGRHLFAYKMAAGAIYHLQLSSNLKKIGFEIGEIGKNGVFEIVAPERTEAEKKEAARFRELQSYFSARRREVEQAIAEEGLLTADAPALAAAIARGTRQSKQKERGSDRFEVWAEEAGQFLTVDRFVERLRTSRDLNPKQREEMIAERIAAVAPALTKHESVFEKRQLFAAVATSLVGTGVDSTRVQVEVDGLIQRGIVVELGRDALEQPIYSTPEQIAIERELVSLTERLAKEKRPAPEHDLVLRLCRDGGLSEEQTRAAQAATTQAAIAVVEGAAGSGKTTMLGPVVAAYQLAGKRVIGSATAWKIALELQTLAIEAKATDAWLAQTSKPFLDRNTVLVVDEAGLLSSRQMHAIVGKAVEAGAKVIFVGDREQLQAIGAGPGLSIVAAVTDTTRVDTIVRQRERWMREAVTDFAKGRAEDGLRAFEQRGCLHFATSEKATVKFLVDAWEKSQTRSPAPSALLIAKTNAQIRALNEEVRDRLKGAGQINGQEIAVSTVTPSGHGQTLHFAAGDRVRFQLRNDTLKVINGTTATITQIESDDTLDPTIRVSIDGRLAAFRLSELADQHGRVRLGHAYSSTIYGAQGLTMDQCFVWADPAMTRHDAYVAFSRARDHVQIVADTRQIDAQVRLDLPLSERRTATITPDERLSWLAARLSRVHVKSCTLDPTLELAARSPVRDRSRDHSRGYAR